MKGLEGAFNQEKALVGAFSVITNLRMELFEALLSSSYLDYVCKAGTLIWYESLVQAVRQPGADHLNLVEVPLLHHVEDPEVVIDPLGDGVHVVPHELHVALAQVHPATRHVDLLRLRMSQG